MALGLRLAVVVALAATTGGSSSSSSSSTEAHVLLEANATAVDDAELSSYLRAPHKQCMPGPRLLAWQGPPLRKPFVPFVTLTEAHSGSTWFRTMLNSHPCVRSHGETLRKRSDLKDLWETLSRPTKTDDPKALKVPLFAAGLKGFFTPTSGGGGTNKRGETTDKSRHDFNPSNKEVYLPVAKFLKESKVPPLPLHNCLFSSRVQTIKNTERRNQRKQKGSCVFCCSL